MEKYILAKTLEEALDFLEKYGDRTQVIAGGTDLILLLKDGKTSPYYVLDITNITGLSHIEGKDILKGTADVIISDGFIGNIMLKTVEGVAFSLFEILKQEFEDDWIAKIGAILSYPAYRHLKKKLDYSEYGGGFLLGVNEISIIAHGHSNAKAISNAIKFASFSKKSKFLSHIKKYYQQKMETKGE